MIRLSTGQRLVLTVWLVLGAHLTSNVVRETYLAVAIGERGTVRVDPYLGLHPDLFEIPGRGAYINSNPGASLLGAVPYALARPLIGLLFWARPALAQPKPPATYDDPRPNRAPLMNAMRARGLDVRLALAAFAIQLGLMAPLAAVMTLLVFRYLSARLGNQRTAFWLALLYGLGTPVFFRSAFLNQNILLAHAVLGAWMLLTWPRPAPDPARSRRWLLAGLCLGLGILLDYSAAPMALVFGVWALVEGWREGGPAGAVRFGGACLLGALPPVAVLLGYQWVAFQSPWFPAQRYMPATEFSVHGWNGMTLPTAELLWGNLFDPRYGLLVFCPLLMAGIAAVVVRRHPAAVPGGQVAVALLACLALLLFNSANQFANLQWNTGVRYMVPAVPLLFLLGVPVLLAAPAWLRWALVGPTLLISWSVSMMREDVPTSLRMLVTEGPTLPMLIVLRKTAAAYAPFLGEGMQPFGVLSVLLVAAAVWLVWRGNHRPWLSAAPPRPTP